MAEATFSFDLHVLGTPPAFVLSQDQTLQLNCEADLRRLRFSEARLLKEAWIFNSRARVLRNCYLVFKDRSVRGIK